MSNEEEERRWPRAWSSYVQSGDIFEIFGCLFFFVVCAIVETISNNNLRERPIPFQLLNSGDYVRNLMFNEEYNGETVPRWGQYLIGLIIPFLSQLILAKILKRQGHIHGILCSYAVAFGLVLVVAGTLKNYVGYLRPVFYHFCDPVEDFSQCNSDDNAGGARRSFPSGHASLTFCGMTLLTSYLQYCFGPNQPLILAHPLPSSPSPPPSPTLSRLSGSSHSPRNNDESSSLSSPPVILQIASSRILSKHALRFRRFYAILSLAPLGVACFVAASRVADNMHFPADVVAGAIIGALSGSFGHGLWFPVLPLIQQEEASNETPNHDVYYRQVT